MSSRSNAPDPLDAAREALQESKKATELLECSEDFDEPTGRTEVTVNLQQPSQPEIKVDAPQTQLNLELATRFRHWPQVAALALLAALVAFLAWLGTR